MRHVRDMLAATQVMDRVKDDRNAALRVIPSLDAFVRREGFVAIARPLLVREARRFLDELRISVQDGARARARPRRCARLRARSGSCSRAASRRPRCATGA